MKHDLPTPDDILEELADKTAAQIERLAPVAFDGAFREMTRYHSFLLALNASRTPDGAAFSFAEVAGDDWTAPHRDWIRQYGRLFERAADRMPNDDHFIRMLAYTPSHLLAARGDYEFSPGIVRIILDLGPIMMHRLEAWLTKRTMVETQKGQAAEPRLALAGSDAKAYANVLPELVGAWEGLLQYAPSMYGWRERGEQTDIERWSAFHASWPFLWQHLSNTAHCLAAAVWNEDESGAALFREALVRWPQALGHQLDDHAHLRYRRLLFPSVLNLRWPQAGLRAALLAYDHMPAPTPDQLFASVISGAHNDVVLLTAALLLFWTINEKQVSNIGGRTARSLLRKEGGDEESDGVRGRDPRFRSLFLDVLRLEVSGERFGEGSYGADLDRLIEVLDTMTERRVVPGRSFVPSTLHDRDDLLVPLIAIMAAALPNDGDDGVGERIVDLAREEELLPEGDRTLRNVVHKLSQFNSTLEQAGTQLSRGIALLSPNSEAERLAVRLREIVSSGEAMIEAERVERLKVRPVDLAKLERIRSAIETALLNEPAKAPFFSGVQVGRAARGEEAEWRDITFSGISKAQFTEPPMESPVSSFEEMFVSGSREVAGKYAWNAFCQRKRIEHTVSARAEEEAFWREIGPLVSQVGPDPVLTLSRTAEGRVLRRLLYAAPADRPNLKIERRSRSETGGSYIARIEGVDVFGAEFPPGVAWLFSSKILRSIRYAELNQPARYVDVTFELGEKVTGILRVRVRQHLVWADTPIFELRALDSDESDSEID